MSDVEVQQRNEKEETSTRLVIFDLAIDGLNFKMLVNICDVPVSTPKCDPTLLQSIKMQFVNSLNNGSMKFIELVDNMEDRNIVLLAVDKIEEIKIKSLMEV